MPRQRQVKLNEATSNAIKEMARRLMAKKGTAGLSLRAIAREMEITAPALYHYFDSLDELITALIVDAFTSHARYVRQARDASVQVGEPLDKQLFAAILAYRSWALGYPMDFQLIYGNPIPGYKAPVDLTVPAASLMGELFMEIIMAAVATGQFTISETYRPVPPTVLVYYQNRFAIDATVGPYFNLMNQMWSLIHGLVSLEIYDHIPPVVGDTDAFFEQTIHQQMQLVGMTMA